MTVIMRICHGVRGDTAARADLFTPQVIRDHVDDLWNPVDGGRITSKRAYAAQLRKSGLEVDDSPRMRDKNAIGYDDAGLRRDILQAMREPSSDAIAERIPELDNG